jgi:invasion protein IalB
VPKLNIDLQFVRRVAVVTALVVASSSGLAAAAESPAANPATAAAVEPQATTATYGAWTLRCITAPAAEAGTATATSAAAPRCEIDQQIVVNGQSAPVAVLAVGPDPASGNLQLVAQLPVGVWLPERPVFGLTATATPVPLTYRRCLPGACFADADINANLESGMRSATAPGLLGFQITAGKDIGLPVSFNGFGAALDALKKQ